MPNKTTRSKSFKLSNTAVISILVALISLFGVALSAYINYMGVRYQVDQPINFTMTAQSIIGDTQTPPISTSVDKPWESILKINFPSNFNYLCSGGIVVPSSIDMTKIDESVSLINTALENEDYLKWAISPTDGYFSSQSVREAGDVELCISITNIDPDKVWIRLGKTVEIKVEIAANIPESVNVIKVGLGGGGGEIYPFSYVELTNSKPQYSKTAELNDFDFYSLEPGEFGEFKIPFICKQPGTYKISLVLNYEYNGKNNFIPLNEVRVVNCPAVISGVKAEIPRGRIDYMDYYYYSKWNGSAYEDSGTIYISTSEGEISCNNGGKEKKFISHLDYARHIMAYVERKSDVNVRETPSLNSNSLGYLHPGEIIFVPDAIPACSNNLLWWEIKSIETGITGWVPEGDSQSYWLLPCQVPLPKCVK